MPIARTLAIGISCLGINAAAGADGAIFAGGFLALARMEDRAEMIGAMAALLPAALPFASVGLAVASAAIIGASAGAVVDSDANDLGQNSKRRDYFKMGTATAGIVVLSALVSGGSLPIAALIGSTCAFSTYAYYKGLSLIGAQID